MRNITAYSFFFFKQKTAYEISVRDWSSDVCSSDLKEVGALVDALNRHIPADQPKLRIPSDKFRRSIGAHAGMTYSVDGQLLSQDDYEKHLQQVMPSAVDDEFVINLEKDKGWILDPSQK